MAQGGANRRSMINSFRVEEDFTNRQIFRVVCAASAYLLLATFVLCLFFTYNLNPVLNPSIETVQIGKPSLFNFPRDFSTQWAASVQMRDALQVWMAGTLGMTAIFAVAIGLVLSKKLAGPIHRLKSDLLRIHGGEKIFPVTLRDGDELQDLAAILNETLLTVESRHVENCAAGSGGMAMDEVMANVAALKTHMRSLSGTVEPSDALTEWATRMGDLIEKIESSDAP